MMEIEKPKILLEEQDNGARALITVEPLEKGFGITIGNMLRRTLLSSLPGAAIVGVKIKNVLHEFSTVIVACAPPSSSSKEIFGFSISIII